ncbi:glycosyltransferase family 2 protein [bacterium]|nr:glycosyltransferase family 2 protein [bacterium]
MSDSRPQKVPVAIVMISLNEAHNMEEVLENISGWAQEVFLVDSCSTDATVDIALKYGVHVVQRRFRGFGDQWNFAMESLPITAPWTMKLDPDERLSLSLKKSIENMVLERNVSGIIVNRRLWFMGKVLTINQAILRIWRTGAAHFTNVLVNEHPIVLGEIKTANGFLEHRDSPNLDHWLIKQNKYTTAEAIGQYKKLKQPIVGRLLGGSLERRMWLKKHFWKFPGRFLLLFCYHFLFLGAWKAGKVGWIWAHLRVEVYRLWEYKYYEMVMLKRLPEQLPSHPGEPDGRVPFYE